MLKILFKLTENDKRVILAILLLVILVFVIDIEEEIPLRHNEANTVKAVLQILESFLCFSGIGPLVSVVFTGTGWDAGYRKWLFGFLAVPADIFPADPDFLFLQI